LSQSEGELMHNVNHGTCYS